MQWVQVQRYTNISLTAILYGQNTKRVGYVPRSRQVRQLEENVRIGHCGRSKAERVTYFRPRHCIHSHVRWWREKERMKLGTWRTSFPNCLHCLVDNVVHQRARWDKSKLCKGYLRYLPYQVRAIYATNTDSLRQSVLAVQLNVNPVVSVVRGFNIPNLMFKLWDTLRYWFSPAFWKTFWCDDGDFSIRNTAVSMHSTEWGLVSESSASSRISLWTPILWDRMGMSADPRRSKTSRTYVHSWWAES